MAGMNREAASPRKRLHLGTWAALALVTIALAYCQIPGRLGLTPLIRGGYWNQTHHGWPLRAIERNARGEWVDNPAGRLAYGPATVTWAVRPAELALDVLCWLALLAGTAFAWESRFRQPGGALQWRLADLLLWTAVAAVLLAWWRADELRYSGTHYNAGTAELLRMDARTLFRGPWAPWFVRLPLLLATGCAVYAALCILIGLVRRLTRCDGRQRAIEGSWERLPSGAGQNHMDTDDCESVPRIRGNDSARMGR